jgi:hypothetical protein
MEVGDNQLIVRLSKTEVTLDQALGKLVSLHQAHPSH